MVLILVVCALFYWRILWISPILICLSCLEEVIVGRAAGHVILLDVQEPTTFQASSH